MSPPTFFLRTTLTQVIIIYLVMNKKSEHHIQCHKPVVNLLFSCLVNISWFPVHPLSRSLINYYHSLQNGRDFFVLFMPGEALARDKCQKNNACFHTIVRAVPSPDTPSNLQPITIFGMDSEYWSYVNSHKNIR